ncbi:hypothetical protein Fmac_004197 [Flemingia macrophylla]|uniref:ABC transporter domain-containing protein n=1 Tax=Flemingia macrophylla TaxID=520843 RepID=A0ABD1N482_9FABA
MQSCEVEVIGINYTIHTHKSEHRFKIFSKPAQLDTEQAGREETKAEAEQSCGGVRHVLKNVSFQAKPWEILAIVGPSGAGKSSLLEILAGKHSPQNGTVLLNHKPVNKAQFRKLSGYVTQKDTLFPLLAVEEILMFSAKLRLKLSQEQLCSRVK